ncbi:MAG: glycosyltransferase family 4 protein [Rhodanobacteraceae bacterium]
MVIDLESWANTPTFALAAFVVSMALTFGVTRYARAHLLDLPGRRRSHAQPTPRGGGLGFVIALLTCGLLPHVRADPTTTSLLGTALIAVAAVGFWDDHESQPAHRRLAVQLFAAGLTVLALKPTLGFAPGSPMALASLIACGLAIVWSINLHNFMDGIDGLLAVQALFVCSTLAIVAQQSTSFALAGLCAISFAAIAGFVPLNFPRARIFMGDVGSATLGLWLGILLIMSVESAGLEPSAALVLVSAFTIDATMTLMLRLVQKRRWYSAHREHLYQWLVRSGSSHTRVTGLYMLWNLLVVVPTLWVMMHLSTDAAWLVAIAVHTAGITIWLSARRYCLSLTRIRGGRDVAA